MHDTFATQWSDTNGGVIKQNHINSYIKKNLDSDMIEITYFHTDSTFIKSKVSIFNKPK